MHTRELVDVATMVAAHGSVLIEGPAAISASALEQYWTASKCRLDVWLRSMKRFAAAEGEPREAAIAVEMQAVLEEVLVSEMVTRVWSAVLYAYDRKRQTGDVEPIARSVFLGHLEVRQRALALLIHSPAISPEQAVALNRLRRRAERWTDTLLAHLSEWYPVDELAFEPERCRDFANDLRDERRGAGHDQAWRLVLASARIAFRTGLSERSPSAAANRDIAGSIVACFSPDLFDGTGVMQSLWLLRLMHTASDAQGLVEELLHGDTDDRAGRSARGGRSVGGFAKRRFH